MRFHVISSPFVVSDQFPNLPRLFHEIADFKRKPFGLLQCGTVSLGELARFLKQTFDSKCKDVFVSRNTTAPIVIRIFSLKFCFDPEENKTS